MSTLFACLHWCSYSLKYKIILNYHFKTLMMKQYKINYWSNLLSKAVQTISYGYDKWDAWEPFKSPHHTLILIEEA